jgi:dimeric dUTPase (all-alpha-NTP-PPase superfamily)
MRQEYLQKIFDANKELDDKFDVIYADVENLDDCNKIELMAELMELANSSRVFKYWKKKPMDYEETLYEYAD